MKRAANSPGARFALVVALGAGCVTLLWGFEPARAKTTWTLVSANPNADNTIIHVTTVDGVSAWAVGVESSGGGNTSPVGLMSTDGSSWSPMTLPQGGGGPLDLILFLALAFTDNQNGWLYGVTVSIQGEEGHLWTTSNGGGSWAEVFLPTEPLAHMQALPTGHFFGAGGQTFVMSSDGQTYVEVNPPVVQDHALKGVFMLNPDCGYLVAATDPDEGSFLSAVLWSGDGGQNWEVRAQDLPYVLSSLWFVNADLGWAAGFEEGGDGVGIIARTTDGGRTFSPVTLPDHPPEMGGDPVPVTGCSAVRFFDDVRGVALCVACSGGCAPGEDPTFLTVFARSNDGGQTWNMDPDYEEVMNAPPFGDMVKFSGMGSLAFPDPNTGFMAGENSLILRYVADDPEQPGWSQSDCSSGNSNTNNANNNGNQNGPGSDDAALSGCGCRLGAVDNRPALWLLALLVFVGAFRLRLLG